MTFVAKGSNWLIAEDPKPTWHLPDSPSHGMYADAPRTTKSMRTALDDLRLERLFVVYPGEKDYALDDRIHVLGLRSVERLADATGGATTLALYG